MPKDKENDDQHQHRGMLVGVVWSCADVKLLLTSLLLICCFATVLQFLPTRDSFPSASLLRSCLTSKPTELLTNFSLTPVAVSSSPSESLSGDGLVVKRLFNPVGTAAYLFIQMSTYRGGANSFAVVGLGSKPIHVFAKPRFHCEWISNNNNTSIHGDASKILPDWGYGRVYTVVIINCTFPAAVGADGAGGRLVLTATSGGGGDRAIETEERILALEEPPSAFNATVYTSAPRYDYLYCGSPLYGNLSPQRVREWVAYHARLFGPRAHFVIYDAGGVHAGVLEVLRPWIEMGVVTLQDIREQERFDGYYHNQFLVVNDCLHRYRFATKWMFFFDVDEFIYLQPKTTLPGLLKELERYTQFTIEQMPMSGMICLSDDANQAPRMWGFEKLVYRNVKRGVRRDRKYAIQPRSAFAAGVHMSQNMAGRTLHKTERRIMYYHYHGTISERREPCREFANATDVMLDRTPYVRDDTLRTIAGAVKLYELKTIGSRLRRTRQ